MTGRLGPGELAKYHALGNAYLVLDADTFGTPLSAALVRQLCDPARGVGSDGLLALAAADAPAAARLAIFNPDGSRAERSGNGLRICARALVELGYAAGPRLQIATDAGTLAVEVATGPAAEAWEVAAAMGTPQFSSGAAGMVGPERPTASLVLPVRGGSVACSVVSVGNPHCVVWDAPLTPARLAELGPQLERHAAFPRRINVQLARVCGRHRVELLIWERGAGATPASGSSACAVVAAAAHRGWLDLPATAHMPGGTLAVADDGAGGLLLRGPTTAVLRGQVIAPGDER